MSTQYTSAQAAEKIGTDPKTLRRFLRATPEWSNPGSGGRYSFTAADIRRLQKQVPAWIASSTPRQVKTTKIKMTATGKAKVVQPKLPPVDTSESPEVWNRPIPARLKGADRVRAKERVDALEARLLATGLHISQIKDRAASA